MIRFFLFCLFTLTLPLSAETLKVAVLHPLLGDMARQIGGDKVEVIDLIGQNGDPHHFEPSPQDLKRADAAAIYFVSGMGLESYLPKLKSIIGNRAKIIEIGATLPALEGACNHEGHDHSSHDHGLDPHWWHSVNLFRRATKVMAAALSEAFPANAEIFAKNAAAYQTRLDQLEKWTRQEISKIPRDKRHLATAHAAFAYLCKDHGFKSYPVQGLNREQIPSPKKLAELIAELKTNQVTTVFPEKESNPKILKTLTADTGIRLGEPLIADGTGVTSYENMVRHNVTAIVKGLSP